jgi:hypothetical protein
MSVVDMTQEREKRKPSKPKLEARYYCTACRQDQFHIMSTGEIRCASCAKRMANIQAMDYGQ